MDVRALFVKYKNIILYLLFGVCTTLVNILFYWVCAHPLGMSVMLSTVIAWILAVLFAYVTNRNWVFSSQARDSKAVLRELVSFFACRVATGFVDWAGMYILVDLLSWNDMLVKAAVNVVVIVLNYVASKLIIFTKNTDN